ncbi:DUF1192 domain-containing protein [Agrobacterium larrymoorei]|uniref:DUF1192 domain-containing protein n=1 Tax=Agrobacterium larrymoorei TaxID=160699 RepID=UPI00157172E0|nr:DUF1192 domain-containing protein [Agrobacterium larrymoorei]NTJ43976.1 DUF1192 domain-containing protein [Agrobacterium larrymoorei]
MSIFDDDQPKKSVSTHVVGSDLSLLSVDDLTARIDILLTEVKRLEEERDKKSAGRKAAENLFRSR